MATKKRKTIPKLVIKEVTLGRTINLGNYESIRLNLTAEVPAGSPAMGVIQQLEQKLNLLAEDAKCRRPLGTSTTCYWCKCHKHNCCCYNDDSAYDY